MQGQLFVQAVIIGAVMMLFYDFLRIWRRIVRHGAAAMAVEDLLFWLICALGLFGFMYRQNEGVIRGFIILGAAAGMFAYAVLFSRKVVWFGTAVLGMFLCVCRSFFRVITAPLRFFLKILKEPLKKAGKAVRIGFGKF